MMVIGMPWGIQSAQAKFVDFDDIFIIYNSQALLWNRQKITP